MTPPTGLNQTEVSSANAGRAPSSAYRRNNCQSVGPSDGSASDMAAQYLRPAGERTKKNPAEAPACAPPAVTTSAPRPSGARSAGQRVSYKIGAAKFRKRRTAARANPFFFLS